MYRDAFRAQYYLSALEKEIASTLTDIALFSFLPVDQKTFLIEFSTTIAQELDQILLPTFASELHKAKNASLLEGNTPFERYVSFFIRKGSYTFQARSFIENHPYLFEMIEGVIRAAFSNLVSCITRFQIDCEEIKTQFLLSDYSIQKIQILSSSDRHRYQQSLLLTLSNNSRLIYKPVDLHPDELFAEFIQTMDFPEFFDLTCRKILAKKEYGWLEYVPIKDCQSLSEVKIFYQRMGVLLSVCDTLNYSDGHCENILAYGAFPLLLDGETLFQNYVMPLSVRKSIISTQLIQKFLRKKKDRIKFPPFKLLKKKNSNHFLLMP